MIRANNIVFCLISLEHIVKTMLKKSTKNENYEEARKMANHRTDFRFWISTSEFRGRFSETRAKVGD